MENIRGGGEGGGGGRGRYWAHPIFNGRRKTRGGGPTDRYIQKRWIVEEDILIVRIGGGGRGCCRRSDSKRNEGDENYGRGMGGSSCYARTRSGSRLRYPWISSRKSSRGTAALGESVTRSSFGSRSGSGSILRRRRLRGEQSGITRVAAAAATAATTSTGTMTRTGTLGTIERTETTEEEGGGRRGIGNCNSNVRSADSDIRRGRKGSVLIPTA